MGEEYKPTTRMGSQGSGGWGAPFTSSEDADREYNPTVQMNPGSGGGYGYDAGGGASSMTKTMRLKREPPTFAWLVIVEGVHAGHTFQLHPDSTVIGRDPSCEMVIDDSAISRQHAKVRVVENDDKQKVFLLHDLATENGTLLNGQEIIREELHDNDQILIGQTKLVFKRVQM